MRDSNNNKNTCIEEGRMCTKKQAKNTGSHLLLWIQKEEKKRGKRGRFFLAVVVGFHCSAWKPKSVFFVCLFVCFFFLVLVHCFYNMQLLFVLSSLCFSSFLLRYLPRCVWACWKLKLVRHGVVDGWHYPTRCNFLQLFLFFFFAVVPAPPPFRWPLFKNNRNLN